MKVSFEQAPTAPITDMLEKEGLSDIVLLAERVGLAELQKEKNEVLFWLRRQLENITQKEEVEGYSRHNTTYTVDGDMETNLSDGKMSEVTLGDILTDGEWEINYTLEKGVSSDIKKQYVSAEAKRQLSRLLDKEIAITEIKREIPETASNDEKSHTQALKDAYDAVLHMEKDNLPTGIIAEKMLETYFKQFEVNNHSPYTLEKANLWDDVVRKIDFVLHKDASALGVEAQEPMERKDVAVQFTTNFDSEKQKEKMRQIKNSKRDFGLGDVDDIVLVTLPLTETRDLYKEWLKKGKSPGGPAKLWKKETEEQVFQEILGKVFTKEELDTMWNNRV